MKSHIFKTAMALSMSDSDNKVINQKHLWNAMNLVQNIRDKVDLTFRSLGESPLAAQQDRVLRYLQIKKGGTATEIFSRMSQHMTYEQFQKILFILEMAGSIRKRPTGKVETYEPVP
jgi:hypothetical protein